MTATGPGTTMGRIAALEARYAELRERLDRFEREVLEPLWKHEPPPRDPASTTAAVTERTWAPTARPPGSAFGFGKDATS